MRAPVWLGVVLTAVLAVPRVMAAPADVLRDCAARASGSATGVAELVRQCPELSGALTDLGYAQSIGKGWQSRLTTSGLHTLAILADHYQPAVKGSPPDSTGVRQIVDGLAREHGQIRSRWDLFLDWLRSLLGNDPDRSLSWLDRWLEKLGGAGSAMTYVMDGLFVSVLIVAAIFLVKELRATGILSRRRSTASLESRSGAAFVARAGEAGAGLAEFTAAPLREQPGLLLRLLVNCLSRNGRVRANRHLTHRELVNGVTLEEAERQRFARVAGLAEAMLYGRRAESMDAAAIHEAERVIDEGRQLLARLEHPSSRV